MLAFRPLPLELADRNVELCTLLRYHLADEGGVIRVKIGGMEWTMARVTVGAAVVARG